MRAGLQSILRMHEEHEEKEAKGFFSKSFFSVRPHKISGANYKHLSVLHGEKRERERK